MHPAVAAIEKQNAAINVIALDRLAFDQDPPSGWAGRTSGEAFEGIFTDYVPGPAGPAFMRLLEKTFGKNITTRTWDTVTKVVAAAEKL